MNTNITIAFLEKLSAAQGPADTAFWLFCNGIVSIIGGSIARRHIEIRLVARSVLGGYQNQIKRGIIPGPAMRHMAFWKGAGYILMLAALAIAAASGFFITAVLYGLSIALFALTGLFIRPSDNYGLHSNLITQAERVYYLRIEAVGLPIIISVAAALWEKNLPLAAMIPILIAVWYESAYFSRKAREFWQSKGVIFEKGLDASNVPDSAG